MGFERFSPRAKRVVELALREALALGNNWIGTEHILLGLLREQEGVAALILRDRVTYDEAKKDVVGILTRTQERDVYAELRDLRARYAEIRQDAPYLPADPFADVFKDRAA